VTIYTKPRGETLRLHFSRQVNGGALWRLASLKDAWLLSALQLLEEFTNVSGRLVIGQKLAGLKIQPIAIFL
jgi:hypothetical protein